MMFLFNRNRGLITFVCGREGSLARDPFDNGCHLLVHDSMRDGYKDEKYSLKIGVAHQVFDDMFGQDLFGGMFNHVGKRLVSII